jgi:type II secretory pathway component PulM
MIERLQQYLQRLTPRERWILVGGGALCVILLIGAILLPLQHRVSATKAQIEKKRDDLVWLRSMAPQLASLQATRTPTLNESLVVLVDRTARDAGFSKSLVGSQPSGDGGLNVRFEKMPFDTLITWLSQLHEQYGVRVDSATVDAANEAGTVTATLVLHAG